jgi:excisionase family DNA binding protein
MERLTLDVKEIMALTGWGRDHVRQMVRDRKLPNVGTRRRLLVPRKALEAYLERA